MVVHVEHRGGSSAPSQPSVPQNTKAFEVLGELQLVSQLEAEIQEWKSFFNDLVKEVEFGK